MELEPDPVGQGMRRLYRGHQQLLGYLVPIIDGEALNPEEREAVAAMVEHAEAFIALDLENLT